MFKYKNYIGSNISGKQDLLMISLSKFYSNNEHIDEIIPYLNGKSKVSLRVIDWFATNYSKKNNIIFYIDKKIKKLSPKSRTLKKKKDDSKYYLSPKNDNNFQFIVYLNYKLQLKAYSKGQFDPFCRRSRLDFHYNKGKILKYIEKNNLCMPDIVAYLEENEGDYFTTTSGQLNFFRWIIKNNIIEYITKNIKEIESDMNTCYKKHYNKSKKNKNIRKKRHELSVSASKSLSKSNVKVILTFN